jgi:hypothetical protein
LPYLSNQWADLDMLYSFGMRKIYTIRKKIKKIKTLFFEKNV